MKRFGFTGRSGAGKTTLIERCLPLLQAEGLRVSVVKHAHQGFDIDRPGKDSWRFREAGAAEVLLASDARWALLHEQHAGGAPVLDELLARLAPCDLVLVEGFNAAPLPRIEVFRAAQGADRRPGLPAGVLAVASDVPVAFGLPCLALDDVPAVVRFMRAALGWS